MSHPCFVYAIDIRAGESQAETRQWPKGVGDEFFFALSS
jgi:hypothetical protein